MMKYEPNQIIIFKLSWNLLFACNDFTFIVVNRCIHIIKNQKCHKNKKIIRSGLANQIDVT